MPRKKIDLDLLTPEEREAEIARRKAWSEKVKQYQFKKGECPNPGGRPKTPDEVKKFLKSEAMKAVERVAKEASNPKNKHYYDANITLIERVYGKAVQPIDADVENKIVVEMPDEVKDLAK